MFGWMGFYIRATDGCNLKEELEIHILVDGYIPNHVEFTESPSTVVGASLIVAVCSAMPSNKFFPVQKVRIFYN